MATLHMDVESCSATQSSILNAKSQIEQQIASLKSTIDGMVGSTWIAPGATQFQGDYASWHSTMTQLMEQLNTLGTRLQTEINAWVEQASQA